MKTLLDYFSLKYICQFYALHIKNEFVCVSETFLLLSEENRNLRISIRATGTVKRFLFGMLVLLLLHMSPVQLKTRGQVPKVQGGQMQFPFDKVPQGRNSGLPTRFPNNFHCIQNGEIFRLGILLPPTDLPAIGHSAPRILDDGLWHRHYINSSTSSMLQLPSKALTVTDAA